MIRSKKITQAARGQDCTYNIPGSCNYNPETTVFCHHPDESGGYGQKSDDICGGFGCSGCHDVLDRRVPFDVGLKDADRQFFMRRAQTRTWRKLIEMGVIKIDGYKP